MRLRYTPDAAAELDAVLPGIAENSPQGAHRVLSRIRATVDLLLQPRCGTPTSLLPLRRIVVRSYPYLIFNEASEDEIIVIGVRHVARDPASMPDAP